jgi:hypothetical protein
LLGTDRKARSLLALTGVEMLWGLWGLLSLPSKDVSALSCGRDWPAGLAEDQRPVIGSTVVVGLTEASSRAGEAGAGMAAGVDSGTTMVPVSVVSMVMVGLARGVLVD